MRVVGRENGARPAICLTSGPHIAERAEAQRARNWFVFATFERRRFSAVPCRLSALLGTQGVQQGLQNAPFGRQNR
jgi:hypothetical protein